MFSELQVISSSVVISGGAEPTSTGVAGVVLRRPMTRNIEMAAWHELVILGDVVAARRSVSLTAYGSDGAPVARYHLTEAWPSKVEVGSLKTGSSSVLTETVTLSCMFMQRVSV